MISQWEKTLHGCWGRNGILKKNNQASRRKKAYHKGILVIQWWFNIPMNTKVLSLTIVTRLIHNAGKYLLISRYPLPTHPIHNFTYKNGGNLDTLPGWPKNCISIDLRGAQVNDMVLRVVTRYISPAWWWTVVSPTQMCWRCQGLSLGRRYAICNQARDMSSSQRYVIVHIVLWIVFRILLDNKLILNLNLNIYHSTECMSSIRQRMCLYKIQT